MSGERERERERGTGRVILIQFILVTALLLYNLTIQEN